MSEDVDQTITRLLRERDAARAERDELLEIVRLHWQAVLAAERARGDRLEAFVTKLANEDWRGNMPHYIMEARRALTESGEPEDQDPGPERRSTDHNLNALLEEARFGYIIRPAPTPEPDDG